ncbi:tyrosine--tRNA ligase [Fulvivirgaceae bacterium BMA12]|uniref:Tyrosine--tRNA ligase n=1 Tax=Agaribacillus aureus TaxID=3051825 RepID=A0ABT8LB05_9BACT|nr:tyrosine--tRNA ligase [Fulvivirgaceae bacterium BMA12]
MKDFIEELEWRGMLHDIMPGTREQLQQEVTSAYIGFDPTSDSLHIGNLATIMLLAHFQRAGHKPYALVGGATGMIGDPSGKSQERQLLDEEQLRYNEECIKKQLSHFLDFDSVSNAAEMVNNYDWFQNVSFLNFLRDTGKHLSINYMLAKDSVKNRLESGLSFTEFSYQLLQGYDFYYLNTHHNVKLQMGGSDQWGNITTGTELIRRKAGKEAFALTTPLLTKSDGSKFGKSEEGNVWLDPTKTSPYKFYQFLLNCADEEAPRLLRVFTFLSKEEVEELEKKHQEAPHLRILQKAIAEELTIRVHSREEFEMAVKASEILFGKSTTDDLASINEATLLSVFEGVPQVTVSRDSLGQENDMLTFLSETTQGLVFASKGEARRMIQGGGVSINKNKITAIDQKLDFELLQDKYLLVQKGRRNYYLVTFD